MRFPLRASSTLEGSLPAPQNLSLLPAEVVTKARTSERSRIYSQTVFPIQPGTECGPLPHGAFGNVDHVRVTLHPGGFKTFPGHPGKLPGGILSGDPNGAGTANAASGCSCGIVTVADENLGAADAT